MSLRTWVPVLGFASMLFVVGCGGGSEVSVGKLVPVGGKLLIDGKPLDGVVITFSPEVSENNRGGSGKTDAQGAFTVTHLNKNEPGLPPGKYTVSYSRMRSPDGSAPPEPKEGEEPDPANIPVETLPTHLITPDLRLPQFQVEIPEGGNSNLELKASLQGPE